MCLPKSAYGIFCDVPISITEKQIFVNQDSYWATARFGLSAGGLEQTNIEVHGPVEVTAILPSTSGDYLYVSDAARQPPDPVK